MAVTLADAYVRLRADPQPLGDDLSKGVKGPAEKAGEQADKSFGEGMEKSSRKRKKKLPLPDDEESKREGFRLGGKIGDALGRGLSTAGGPIARALSNVFGVLPPQAQVAIGGGIVGAIVLAAPLISAATAGAVLAGFGTGAVAAGIAASFQDRRVKAAGKGIVDDLKAEFEAVGGDFVGPVIAALSRVRTFVRGLGLREALAPAAGYVEPLTTALLGLVTNVMPAVKRAIIAAKEPLIAFTQVLPQLGAAVASLLDLFSRNADTAADALKLVVQIAIIGIGAIEAQLAVLIAGFSVMQKIYQFVRAAQGDAEPLIAAHYEAQRRAKEGTEEWDSALGGLQKELDAVTGSTTTSTAAVKDWSQTLQEATNVNLSARAARRDLEAAIDDSTAAIKENGKNLDINTAKGRANQAALDAIHAAGFRAAAAAREQGQSTQQANAILERARKAYVEAAVAAGQNRKEVEALSRQLFGLPKDVRGTITYNDTPARQAISRVVQAAGRVKDIHRGIYYTVKGDLKVPGGTLTKRWGGIDYAGSHHKMQIGGVANVYNGRTSPLVTFAEPATGGEAYIPRFGNMARSLEILAEAASWYKMGIVPLAPKSPNEPPSTAARLASKRASGKAQAMGLPFRPMETDEESATMDDVLEALEKLIAAVFTIAPDVGSEINGVGGSLRTSSRTR